MIELLIAIGIFLLIAALLLMITTAKTNTKTMTFHSNNPEDLKKFMEQNNFPTEMIQNISENNGTFTTNVTTTQTTRTVKYVNGKLVSDQTQTETSRPLTNCPNCGATIEPENDGTCRYCGASFNTYRINQ